MQYNFEWDEKKAKTNLVKHKIPFEMAAVVFKDPNAITIFDEDHSDGEERWITMGASSEGIVLVVCHTFVKVGKNTASIRIFSSRKATKNETKQYLDGLA